MLGSILSSEKCKNCRICCSFVSEDVWEAPMLTDPLTKEKYRVKYEFKDEKEILLCPGLDENTGCKMGEYKPFECKIWPLRPYMEDGKMRIAIAKICPAFDKKDDEKIKELLSSGLYEEIRKQAMTNPEILKELNDEYRILG